MLKSVLFSLLFLTTSVRFADILYLLTKDRTNLPTTVILMTTAMVIYGLVLIVKRFIGNIRLKQLQMFYMVQTAMIAFNIIFMSVACPLRINAAETLVVGTFLDLIVNCGIIFFCTKQMRRGYISVSRF